MIPEKEFMVRTETKAVYKTGDIQDMVRNSVGFFWSTDKYDEKKRVATSLRDRGRAEWVDGNYENSRMLLKNASDMFLKLGMYDQRFKTNVSLGLTESCMGNFKESEKIYKMLLFTLSMPKRREGLIESGIKRKQLNMLSAKIKLYYSIDLSKREEWKMAAHYAGLAKKEFKDEYYVCVCMQGEGLALIGKGQYKKALEVLRKTLRKVKKIKNSAYKELNLIESIARCLREMKQYKKAISLLNGCIRSYGKMGVERTWPHFHRAQCYEKLGDLDSAISDYESAVKIIETKRGDFKADVNRKFFFARQVSVYGHFIKCLIKAKKYDLAYHVAQKSKARDFNDKLDASDTISVSSKPEFLELMDIQRKIDDIYGKDDPGERRVFNHGNLMLKRFESMYESKLRTIKEKYPALADDVIPNFVSVNEIKENLPKESVVLDYYFAGDVLFLFCITKNGIIVREVPSSKKELLEMAENVRLWVYNIESTLGKSEKLKKEKGFYWYLKHLYKILIEPVEDNIKDVKNIFLIPHYSLHHLPFCLLVSSDNKFLIEKHSLSVLPTAKLMVIKEKTSSIEGLNALFISNPLGDLSSADLEVNELKDIFKESKVLSGKDAGKHNILKAIPGYGILHFACHAKINERRPMFSELIVAGKEGNKKGRITLNEIYYLKNKADLVVLSCCETGIGDINLTDDITCFPRAFMHAGAKNVLVSLWEIDDESTAEFMKQFYNEHYVNKRSKQLALRNAKLYMKKQGYTPYHWSAFQLVGS